MTDVNSALIEHLRQRAAFGANKYGVELTAFNGRNPLKDKREELLDALVYNEQDIMEREEIAGLLRMASDCLYVHTEGGEIVERVRTRLLDMAVKLRQDIKRIEPEEVGPYAHLACSPDCPVNHVDPTGEDVTDQFVKRIWTPEEVSAKISEINNEGEYD
jgi:hypothetical protein